MDPNLGPHFISWPPTSVLSSVTALLPRLLEQWYRWSGTPWSSGSFLVETQNLFLDKIGLCLRVRPLFFLIWVRSVIPPKYYLFPVDLALYLVLFPLLPCLITPLFRIPFFFLESGMTSALTPFLFLFLLRVTNRTRYRSLRPSPCPNPLYPYPDQNLWHS